MKRALVTGGGGFLGRAIVDDLLRDGWQISSLGRKAHADLASRGVQQIVGDIRDPQAVRQACRGVETVFHTAALAGIWGDADDFYSINVEGTRNVILACREAGVRKLVHSSSPSVVFDGQDQLNANEDTPYPTHYLCDYPRTKAMAERDVLSANGVDGLLTVALRPHLIWGVGDNHLIPTLLKRARAGQLRIIGRGDKLVDMVHVRNASHAHILADQALSAGKAAGQCYFITNGEPVVLWDWVNNLLGRLQIPTVQRHIPASLAYSAGTLLEAVHRAFHLRSEPRMTRFLARQLSTHHTYDISRAKSELGYEPLVSMKEGEDELVSHVIN